MATGATVVLNTASIRAIEQCNINAAIQTAFSIRDDVDTSQTVPYRTGVMNQSCFVDTSNVLNKGIQIKYSTPYVGYQYFTPGLNHYTGQHANATDHWLDPYLSTGAKKNFAKEKFSEHFRREMRRV